MNFLVTLSVRAEAGVEATVDHLLLTSPSAAEKFYRPVDQLADSLSELPNRGTARRFSALGALRWSPLQRFEAYHAFYKTYQREKRVLILRILRTARDLETEL